MEEFQSKLQRELVLELVPMCHFHNCHLKYLSLWQYCSAFLPLESYYNPGAWKIIVSNIYLNSRGRPQELCALREKSRLDGEKGVAPPNLNRVQPLEGNLSL